MLFNFGSEFNNHGFCFHLFYKLWYWQRKFFYYTAVFMINVVINKNIKSLYIRHKFNNIKMLIKNLKYVKLIIFFNYWFYWHRTCLITCMYNYIWLTVELTFNLLSDKIISNKYTSVNKYVPKFSINIFLYFTDNLKSIGNYLQSSMNMSLGNLLKEISIHKIVVEIA